MRRLAVMLGVVVLSMVPASANAGADVRGRWSAVLERNGLPQPTFLNVKSLTPGEQYAAKLEFTQPRSCNMNFEYGGELRGLDIFYINSNYCDNNNRDRLILRVKLTPDANIYYEVLSSQGKVMESAVLKRAE